MNKVICQTCRGNGYIKAIGMNEQKKSVLQIISQCQTCNSQGEVMTKKGKLIFKIKSLVLKCRQKAKFLLAIKLKNILKEIK